MIQFFSEVKNELLKVVWPTKSQTVSYTLAIIFLSLFVAGFLGLADFGLIRLFQAII